MNLRFAAICAALVLGAGVMPASAQNQSGTAAGIVQDEQGGALPGATVTLSSPGHTATFTTGQDGRYRFLNVPPGTYTLTTHLTGFTRLVREGIIVGVGATVDIPVSLRLATMQETVTVSGESPIVDSKATGTATNFTQDELARIPNSRDPWALLRTVPGVVMDRVNIAGNETGQQSGFAAKGTRREDAVWTLDGVVITDMAAVGASPTYFDYDAFQEIQISTSGQDLRQPTGGVGLNFVVKRGSNNFRGTARGYFTNDELESTNVPKELLDIGITPATANHNKQIADYGFDLGGPILRDRLFAWGSWTKQDIRLVRSSGNLIDRTLLVTRNVKLNWQANAAHNISALHFLGSKLKTGRGTGAASLEPPSATWNQGDKFPDNPFNGLWKVEDNWVVTPGLFASVKYAYYGTGFALEPAGGLDAQSTISARLGQSFGTTRAARFLRPQHIFNLDGSHFRTALGGSHDLKFGIGYRRTDSFSQTLWPGDMVVGLDNSVTDRRARLYREGAGTDRTEYFHLYAGDTLSMDRLTLNLGVRYDRQWGAALPSDTISNKAFPNVVPGISFEGYKAPFTWNNISPRVSAAYALDSAGRTQLRAGFSRYASQLNTGAVGFMNPSASVGFVDFPWVDLNGDNFVQPNEVVFGGAPLAFGNGFNPASPTAVTSANRIDPNLKAPVNTGIVVGLDRELAPNFALQVSYNYGRGTNHIATPWRGVTSADFTPGAAVTGTLPEGGTYAVPIFLPNATAVSAGGSGRSYTNYEDYHTTFSGLDLSLVKRLSNRWMARVAASLNDAREYYNMNPPVSDIGNPTRLDTQPLVQGGQTAPRSAGSGAGDVFMNAKWQINANGAYLLPWNMEVAGNLFGRQGTAFPYFRQVSLGLDGSQRVLVSDRVDSVRFPDLWNLDLRWAKNFNPGRLNSQLTVDLFNVTNTNTELNRIRNVASPNFGRITDNISPRIVRFGVRFGF
ncbi:MAG: TonB-dependent receptor [Acidobacteria bacterium]|nr:TonB-dependent receptor [Acidobacteriota bacterium]